MVAQVVQQKIKLQEDKNNGRKGNNKKDKGVDLDKKNLILKMVVVKNA